MTIFSLVLKTAASVVLLSFFLTSCATQQGYRGANVGALTGATAGILLDPDNPWRGAVLGGSLGAAFGGALTDQQYYSGYQQYAPSCPPPSDYYNQQYLYQPRYQQYRQPYANRNDAVSRGAAYGGVAGAAAGALIDDGNRWRGGLIGGALGAFFGGGISFINSTPGVPVLQP